MYASLHLPYISTPSRVTPRSKTLTDNIFSNNIEDGSISGNIVTTISDHYAQFLLIQNLNNKNSANSLRSQKTYYPQSTTKIKHIESIAGQYYKLEEASCTIYLKSIAIQLIR